MIGMFFPGALMALPFLGMLNVLKVTKILRVARMLRLLRVLKIFKGMSAEEQKKRQAQLSSIISLTIVTIVTVLFVTSFFPTLFYNQDAQIKIRTNYYASMLKEDYKAMMHRDKNMIRYFHSMLNDDKNVIYMFNNMGQTVVNHIGEYQPGKYIPSNYFYTDFKVLNMFKFKLWVSTLDITKNNARINLLLETLIIVLIFSLMIFYRDPAAKRE